ncbi:MAG: GNAT family N-acetyltransferase [Bacteroidota bacterium]
MTLVFDFFDGTDPRLPEALLIREAVFVREQGIDPNLELDDYDFIAWHVLVKDDEKPVGTARLVTQDAQTTKIGRVAVLPEARGRGIARMMVSMLVEYSKREGFSRVILDAQLPVVPFYEKLGFKGTGQFFLDADLPHQRMELDLRGSVH